MTTRQKIEEIINRRYNNYQGSISQQIKALHDEIWRLEGDEGFLKFLEMLEEKNKRPIYQQ